MLVEDDAALRRALIRAGGRTVSWLEHDTFQSAASSLDALAHPPSGAIVDVELPDGDGCDLALLLRERFPATTLLLISGRRIPTFTHRAYLSNIPFVLKPISAVEVREFLRRLELARLPADGVMERVQRVAAQYRLSPAQVRLLSRLVTGASRAEVAAELGISVNTLKRRTRILLRETAQRTTRDLVRLVLSG